MALVNHVKIALSAVAVTLVMCGQPLLAQNSATDEASYIEHLQAKLIKVYFPPRGPYNFAESELKVKIEPDGKAKLESITKPPVVRGKRNPAAEQCLRSAIENVNPLETPPKDMKLPAIFSVKFVRQQNAATIFKCAVKRL